MKTAKEHLIQFKYEEELEGFDKAVYKLVITLMEEVTELSKIRKSSTNATMISCIKEIDMKWRSICSKEPQLNKSGFSALIQKDLGITL